MKKTSIILLVLLLVLPIIALGEVVVKKKVGLDKAVLENSGLYSYDKFTKDWRLYGEWINDSEYGTVTVYFLYLKSDVEQKTGPSVGFSFYDKASDSYTTVTAFRAILDEKLYTFEKLSQFYTFGFAYGGKVLQAFMNSLKAAKEAAFQLVYTNKYGISYNYNIEQIVISQLSQLAEVADVIEKSNAWSIVSAYDMLRLDSQYGVSVE